MMEVKLRLPMHDWLQQATAAQVWYRCSPSGQASSVMRRQACSAFKNT